MGFGRPSAASMRANGGGVEMNRFVQLIHWPVAGPSVCGILLLVV